MIATPKSQKGLNYIIPLFFDEFDQNRRLFFLAGCSRVSGLGLRFRFVMLCRMVMVSMVSYVFLAVMSGGVALALALGGRRFGIRTLGIL